MILQLYFFLVGLTSLCQSANILYVMPFTSKSHHINLKPIGLELARKGHNVTVITGYRDSKPPPGYHQVTVDKKEIWDIIGVKRPNVFTMVGLSAEKFHEHILWKGGLAFTELALNSSEVRGLLSQDLQFDLVISEQFFQEAMNALAYKYGAPLVLVSTYGNCMRHNIATRHPQQLATVISEFLDVREPSSFWARLRNFYFTYYEYFWWKYWYLEKHEALVRKYIPNLPQPVPSLFEMQKNASLILINSHFSFDPPTAYLPNVVEIGGSHLSKSDAKLPEDLQKLLDEAKHGVIYVNFGSNVRSSELPDEKKNAFLKVFRGLKQTVLWKWEDDTLTNRPDNLITRKWMPQAEILSHPNIKVFISHGGLIGTQEAIFHGVPIVGIPIYADQYNNLLQAQNMGIGKILEFHNINEETLESILTEVLQNDTYRDKARAISVRFKDRPLSPLDTAIYWIEYVLRYKGASYMKNPAIELSWIAYTMLDVYAFVFLVTVGMAIVLFYVLNVIIRFIRPKNNVQSTKEKRQ